MNAKDYIGSGLLEAYVLGALPEGDRLAVEAAIARHPDVAAEIAAIEETMYLLAKETAEAPPANMQEHIWNAMQTVPAPEEPAHIVIPFNRRERRIQVRWQRAAVWIALVGSMLTNFVLWFQGNNATQQNKVLLAKVDTMNARQQVLAGRVHMFEKAQAMLLDTGMKTVVMRSLKPEKQMAGMVFMGKHKKEAYIALHNMPMPPKGMQYQLWVMQDGKPVDMGMIQNDMVAANGMQQIQKIIPGVQAFAISLEKEGGSPTPNMEMVMMMGEVKS